MRTLLVLLTLCYVVDAVAFDGRYLATAAEQLRSESASISAKSSRYLSSWMTPG
jgi:hypothetical protein